MSVVTETSETLGPLKDSSTKVFNILNKIRKPRTP